VSVASIAGISLPAFWFGLTLQIVFAAGLGWLPSSGRTTLGAGDFTDRLQHMVLPVAVLAAVQAAGWSRYLRASMINVLAQPFVVAVRARGVPARRVVLRHALRNALAPLLTVVLVDAALIVSGAVVTESVFAWPGLGSLFTEALARRDYSVLMALLMSTSTAVVVLNFVADAVYALLDPRITTA
jgi:peptide/nickel transport system permease protein